MAAANAEHFGVDPNFFDHKPFDAPALVAKALEHVRTLPIHDGPIHRTDYDLDGDHLPAAIAALIPLAVRVMRQPVTHVSGLHYKAWDDGRAVHPEVLPAEQRDRFKGKVGTLWLHDRLDIRSGAAGKSTVNPGTLLMHRADFNYALDIPHVQATGKAVIFGFDPTKGDSPE